MSERELLSLSEPSVNVAAVALLTAWHHRRAATPSLVPATIAVHPSRACVVCGVDRQLSLLRSAEEGVTTASLRNHGDCDGDTTELPLPRMLAAEAALSGRPCGHTPHLEREVLARMRAAGFCSAKFSTLPPPREARADEDIAACAALDALVAALAPPS